MKYDFRTFLKQTLNEADKQTVYSNGKFNTTDTDEIETWLSKRKDSLKVSKDNKLIYTNAEGKDINLTDNNKDIDLVKIYKEIRSTSTDKGVVKSYNKDTFEKLGETYAYRSIVCLVSLNNVNDFKEITNDVFENDPDNVLMQINDLPAYFDFAAACTTVSHKLNKEENDSESAKIATQCKTLLSDPKTRFEGIEKTKKEIKEDFTKYHDIFTKAFDDGLKEQHKKMSEKDFKWVDPATGLPPKGFKGNAAKILGKGIESITAIGNKFADKIKSSPHNLENDIARAAIIGVKMIAAGVHSIGKLFGIFGNKKFTYKNITSKSVDKKINEFKPKYEEAKKGNYLPSQIKKESTEENKKKCEQFKRDFQSLMYDELIPMYYKQTQVFSECYLNLNDKYILKQTEYGWQTKQTENGKYTELWNAVLLLKEHIDKCDKFFKSLNLYDEFKDSKMELFLGSVEKNTPNEFQQSILDWINKINTDETDEEKVNVLKQIVNIYTEDIMMPSLELNSDTFAQYKDKLNKALQALNVIKEISVINDFKIKFKTEDITSKVKGIIPLKTENKEETKTEELPDEIQEKEEQEYTKIMNSLTTLSKVNNTNEMVNNFDKTNEEINKAYELMKNNIAKLDNDMAKKLLSILDMNNPDMLKKLMYLNTVKSTGLFKESTVLSETLILLEGANADELFNKVYSYLKKEQLTDEDIRKFNHYYTQFVQKISNILKSGNIKDNELKELLTKNKDPLERYYILKKWDEKSKEAKTEEKKEGEPTEDTTKNGEKDQETKSS